MNACELGALHCFDSSNEGMARRIALLTELVLDLALEVEALRAERAGAAAKTGDGAYAEAYMKSAAVAHSGAGVVPGWLKLMTRFYSTSEEDNTLDGRPLRELLLLRRLGVDEDRLRAFAEHIRHVESLT
jgi:hypothetical protein